MKYHLITYGCQMNTADAQEMARPLEGRGFSATDELQRADVVIMNSCTVRQHAEDKAMSNLGRLREWKDANPNRIVIFAGCAATLWGDNLKKRFPFVDLVSPATKIEEFPQAVARVLAERWDWRAETAETFRTGEPGIRRIGEIEGDTTESPVLRFPGSPVRPFTNSAGALFGDERTAYVTIMRGCNYQCSYCIVPQVRGREVYRPMRDILDEIRERVSEGFKEVMLLGQTVNSYYDHNFSRSPSSSPQIVSGDDEKAGKKTVNDFSDLLLAVNEIDGLERIRFMSPHPKHMKDRVIATMATCRKVVRHVHLPLQSGSDTMLAAMKRFYTREEYRAIVEKMRAAMPGILITTDVIVGFPGETRAEFEKTVSLIKEIGFDGIFSFLYSPRPGTASANLVDDVPVVEKESRLQEVLALHRERAEAATGSR